MQKGVIRVLASLALDQLLNVHQTIEGQPFLFENVS